MEQTKVLGSGSTTEPGLVLMYWFWFLKYRGSPGSLDLLMIVCGVGDDHLQVLCWVPLRNVLLELLLYLVVQSFTEWWPRPIFTPDRLRLSGRGFIPSDLAELLPGNQISCETCFRVTPLYCLLFLLHNFTETCSIKFRTFGTWSFKYGV